MTAEARPEHSPLGGSGAYRWMVCPGSVSLSEGVSDEESDFAALGTAAHTLAEICVTQGKEPWAMIGQDLTHNPGEWVVDKEMADAVQVWVDALEAWHPPHKRNQSNTFVERPFHAPDIHPLMWGKGDFVYVDDEEQTLHIWDYKHGAGIIIDCEWNPQLMYYAAGTLDSLRAWDQIDIVMLHVVQPRGWHSAGPVRQWGITTDDLDAWVSDELIPAMKRTETSDETKSGEHCRFCPARFTKCPQLMSDMKEMEELMAREEPNTEELGRFLELHRTSKIVNKAWEKLAFNRMQAGQTVPGSKLVHGRANRTWKDGAETALKKKFGKKAYTKPVLLSPAQLEALPGGAAEVARWAEKPTAGLTVAPVDDRRLAVNPKNVKEMFNKVKKEKK